MDFVLKENKIVMVVAFLAKVLPKGSMIVKGLDQVGVDWLRWSLVGLVVCIVLPDGGWGGPESIDCRDVMGNVIYSVTETDRSRTGSDEVNILWKPD